MTERPSSPAEARRAAYNAFVAAGVDHDGALQLVRRIEAATGPGPVACTPGEGSCLPVPSPGTLASPPGAVIVGTTPIAPWRTNDIAGSEIVPHLATVAARQPPVAPRTPRSPDGPAPRSRQRTALG